MEKKNLKSYASPKMEVVEVKISSQILAGSGGGVVPEEPIYE